MASTRLDNAFRIRDYLDNPYPDAPNFHQIFRIEIAEEQDIINELNDTGRAWTTFEYKFTYMPGRNTYPINVTNFGKAILVVRLTDNCYIPALPVPFDDITDQRYGTLLAGFYGAWGYPYVWNETLEHISFYRQGTMNAQPMVKINPAPDQTCEYVITYLPGYQGDSDALASTVMLPEHIELLRLRSAMSLLPYSKWYEDEKANKDKRQELAAAFTYQLQRKEANYRQYISSIAHGRDTMIEYWNS